MNTSRSSCEERLDGELELSITRPPAPAFRVGLKLRSTFYSILGHVNTQLIFFEYHFNDFIPDVLQRNSFFIFKRSVRSPSTVYFPFMKAV